MLQRRVAVSLIAVALVSAAGCIPPPAPSPNRPPVAVAAATTPATGRAPLAVSFSSAGSTDPDGTIVSYRWKWGDGTADGTTATPTHTFTAAGTYVVTLTVTDDDGATGTASTTVVVSPNQAPLAAASTPTPVVDAPATVPFSSQGSADPDGTIVSYSWDFGDGGPTSAAANPTRSFTDPGSYTVTLTVVDDDGATDVASLHLQVLPANQAPVAVANATPATGNLKAPLTVEFSSAGSTDPDGTIVSFAWDFGDGTTSTQANPTHTYSAEGVYTATLTVTDDRVVPGPLTDTATVVVTVNPPNTAPTAAAAATPSSGTAPLSVQFDPTGSSDGDGTIVSYSWDFGDGNGSSAPSPTHLYTSAGTFVVTLTVTDDDGATATATATVHVVPNLFPTAVATATPASGKGPLTVQFSSVGSADPDGTVASYRWDFGDGSSPSTDPAPAHTFAVSPEPYTVTLTVTDDRGDTDTATLEVVSAPNALPVAVANSDVAAGEAPLAVSFTSAGSADPDGTIVSRSWDLGDGATSTEPDPTHVFAVAGTYTVTLTIADDDGATASAALSIVVHPGSTTTTSTTTTSTTTTTTTVPEPPYPPGLTEHLLQVGGVTRRYLVHVPPTLVEPRGVVMVLHGGGGAGAGVSELGTHPLSVFRTVADREGFVVAYPEGLPADDAEGNRGWVDCRADNTVSSGADDIAFLSTLAEGLADDYGLAQSRVFMAGSSNGAQMTHAFAVHHPELVGAVATGNGSLPLNPLPGPCTQGPSQPVPIVLIHGTADTQMPYNGGCVANIGGACNRGRVISATATRDRWLQINGLSGVVPTETVVNLTQLDAGDAHRFEYAGPVPVEWWRLDDAGHTVPSRAVQVPPSPLVGIQNRDVEFAEVAWDFFERQLPPG